jgi:outer membrane protein insertion porin family
MKAKRHVCICLAIMAFATMAAVLPAADIGALAFEQENGYRFPEEMLQYHVQSRTGRPFDLRILNEDVKRLYATGQFEDVVADHAEQPDGTVRIAFRVKARPRIAAIRFTGNYKVKEEKLREDVALETGTPLNDLKLKDSLAALRARYHGKGYYAMTVTPLIEKGEDGYVDLTFQIAENLRRKVAGVEFVGNTVHSAWRLRETVATRHSYWSWLFETGLVNEEEIENDKLRLREKYWESGHLDFRVAGVELRPDPAAPEKITVVFTLEEGEPYRVGEISVAGAERITPDEFQPLLRQQPEAIYDQRLVRADLGIIRGQYYPLGYSDLVCDIERIPHPDTHTVDVLYRVNEGRPYTVRDIRISGNRITKDKVLRRELALEPGDPMDKNRLDASRDRLLGMGYFNTVEAVTVDTEEADQQDVDITVEEKNTAKFTIGGGYSDSDSLVGMLELSESNFDIAEPRKWFRGGGQRASLRAQYGLERSDFTASFAEPWLFNYPLRLDTSAFYRDRRYDDWKETRTGGEVGLTKYRILDDFNAVSLSQYMAAVRIYDMDDDLKVGKNQKYFGDDEGTDFVNTTTLTLSRDTRNSLIDPTEGYLLELAGSVNAGNHVYCRVEGTASRYWGFWDDMFVLHTGLRTGMVGGGHVPIYERYFLGGGESLRGFKYRDVGPANDHGDVYGGKTMVLGTVEVTHPIWDFVRGAVFMDVGNAWWSGGNFGEVNMGAGYGLRVKLPYVNAPMKFDLAYPIIIDQKHIDRKLRFHFNVGVAW